MESLLLASRNANKTREFRALLGKDFDVHDLNSFHEIAISEETGLTFEENAISKAMAASRDRHLVGASRRDARTAQCAVPTYILGEDSGLEVHALGGAPGVFSARYAGENATDKENIDKLLRELTRKKVPPDRRSARFRCVIALVRENQLLGKFEGIVQGSIVDPPRGSGGFGYDPIFVPNGFGETFAELPVDVKNRISHRARAIRTLAAKLAGS
jgi:XTP/dITP diphosphohydrolase